MRNPTPSDQVEQPEGLPSSTACADQEGKGVIGATASDNVD